MLKSAIKKVNLCLSTKISIWDNTSKKLTAIGRKDKWKMSDAHASDYEKPNDSKLYNMI